MTTLVVIFPVQLRVEVPGRVQSPVTPQVVVASTAVLYVLYRTAPLYLDLDLPVRAAAAAARTSRHKMTILPKKVGLL